MKIFTCWYCGNAISNDYDRPHNRMYHDDCHAKAELAKDKQLKEYLELKTRVMYERALKNMEKQEYICLADYYDEAQLVLETALNDPNKFQSSDEMMTAMELLRNRIHTKVQYKLGRRRIDFLLPDLKVALEIDGALHKFKVTKDTQREIEITNQLNQSEKGWEVIRIPTNLIESHLTRLVPAIKKLYDTRQKLRAENNGFIPLNWSRTSSMAQALVIKDKELEEELAEPGNEL